MRLDRKAHFEMHNLRCDIAERLHKKSRVKILGSISLREYLAVYHVNSREPALLLPIAKKTLWDNLGKARDVVEP